ncbi:MAG: hypothetical protein GXP62_01280 [Oligoflexia bacterium]|nr:hypothetical protein [Oligoflexia bacterium]
MTRSQGSRRKRHLLSLVALPLLLAGCAKDGDKVQQTGTGTGTDTGADTTPWAPDGLSPETILIEDHYCFEDVEVLDDSLIFHFSCDVDQIGIDVGTILTGGSGGGYLRRVRTVSIAGDQVTVETVPASIVEAIGEPTSFSQTLSPGASGTDSRSARSRSGDVLDLSGPLYEGNIDGVDVEVGLSTAAIQIDYELTLEGELDYLRLSEFNASLDLWLTVDLDAYATVSGDLDYASDPVSLLGGVPISFTAVFYIGPLPVWVDVDLDIYAGVVLAVRAEMQVQAGYDAEVWAQAGARYGEDSGWEGAWDSSHSAAFHQPEWDAYAEVDPLEVWIEPTVSTSLYSTAGPSFGIQTYVDTTAYLSTEQLDWAVTLGQEASVGFNVSAFSTDLVDYNATVGSWQEELGSGTVSFGGKKGGERWAGDCDDGVDNDKDGFTDCDDLDCEGDEACPVEIDAVDPTSAMQGTMVSVSISGSNFLDDPDDGLGARLDAGPGVTVSDAQVLSATTISATFDVGCDAPAGMVTIELAQPTEADDSTCDSAGRACFDGFEVVEDARCGLPEEETLCDDDVDNDGDGFTDCDDRDCAGDAACSTWPWGEVSLYGADAEFTGAASDDRAGSAVASAGDVNGDGYDDILIGAYYNDDGGSNAGAAYLVLGGSSVASTSLDSADAQFTGEASNDYAGYAVAGIGDVNADGYDDILIGADGNDDGGSYAGAAYLVLGGSSVASTSLDGADAQFTGEASDLAGYAVAGAGDVNADGYDDILIGAIYNDAAASGAGAAYLVMGGAAPASLSLSSADVRYTGEESFDYAGNAVAGAGDVDGDGYDDVLIGAYRNDDSIAGAAYLVLGGMRMSSTSLSSADAQFTGEASTDYAGYAVAGVGDVNGDGYDDVLIGAYRNDDGGSTWCSGAAAWPRAACPAPMPSLRGRHPITMQAGPWVALVTWMAMATTTS